MAKRMKLTNNAVMDKVLHLNQLLETRDSDRLRKLDEQMSKVSSRQDIPLSQKLKDFEETLASYRQVLANIIRAGSTSVLDGNVEKVVHGLMKKFFEYEKTKETATIPEASLSVEDASVDPPTPPAGPTTPAPPPTPAAALGATPVSSRTPDTSFQDEDFQSPQYVTKSALHKKFNSLLAKRGLIMNSKKVLFPALKKSGTFARSNYDKVMSYLTSDTATAPPYNTTRLMEAVYNEIKNELNDDLIQNFPNLKAVANSVNGVNKWMELDS